MAFIVTSAVALPSTRLWMHKRLVINLIDHRYSVPCLQTWGKYRYHHQLRNCPKLIAAKQQQRQQHDFTASSLPVLSARSRRRGIQTAAVLAALEIRMPSLSPTMTEGTIVEWHKREGDSIAPGDVLCDIQTDKAVMSFELEEEGILAKILVPKDAKNVPIGQLIAIVVEEGEDVDAVEIPSASTAPSSSTPAAAAATELAATLPSTAPSAPSASIVGTILKMPSLSPTMNEGTIVEWLKKEGDVIHAGDLLCEIQTDKAVVGFELEEEGFLAKILVSSEDSKGIPVGKPIAIIVDDAADIDNVAVPVATAAVGTTSASPTPPVPAPSPSPLPSTPSIVPTVTSPASPPPPPAQHDEPEVYSGRIEKFGPAVRMLLQLYGLDESALPRTGPKGWLLKTDVLNYIHRNKLVPQPQSVSLPPFVDKAPSTTPITATIPKKKSEESMAAAISSVATPYRDIELTSMRKTIAKRLTESKTSIPHTYAVIDCGVDAVLSLRKTMKEKHEANVSVNDFIIKAVALALERVPSVNAIWDEAKGEGFPAPSVDISVAVATPGGLITPIVKDAGGCGIQDIANAVKTLAGKARDGRLQPHEFVGGSFTISNLGMFGVSEFTAVINPPQAAILAIGSSRVRPGLDGEPETMMKVTLSYDARMVDDDKAFLFLEAFRDSMENPMALV